MKKIDAQIDEKTIHDLIEQDVIGRNADLKQILGLLNNIEPPFACMLDAGWGEGKTVFLKQLELVLKQLNPHLSCSHPVKASLNRLLPSASSTGNDYYFLPVYYNAWENDYWGDPLPSLAFAIAHAAGIDFMAEAAVNTGDALLAMLSAFGGENSFISHLGDVKNAVTGEDLLKAYNERCELRSRVSDLIGEAVVERGNVLVLMIDELDRCRPTFALRLLEEVKCLFEDDRLIIIYASNCEQLAHMVEKAYGNDVDGRAYLTRFYDYRFGLTGPSKENYSQQIVEQTQIEIPQFSPLNIADDFQLSLREVNRYLQELEMKRDRINSLPSCDSVDKYVKTAFIPVMLAIKVSSPHDHDQILRHQNSEILHSYIQRSEYISRCLQMVISQSSRQRNGTEEDDVEMKQDTEALEYTFLTSLLICMTESNLFSNRFKKAHAFLGEWSDVNMLKAAYKLCS